MIFGILYSNWYLVNYYENCKMIENLSTQFSPLYSYARDLSLFIKHPIYQYSKNLYNLLFTLFILLYNYNIHNVKI